MVETRTRLEKLDYKILRNARRREVVLLSGASGAGKSLLMTDLIADTLMRYYIINTAYAHLLGTKLLPLPLNVWSNYPVSFEYVPADDGMSWPGASKPVQLTSLMLDVERLYTFAPEMREGKVFIDELDLIADRQDWMSGGQKLLMAIMRQIRKRHMGMTASIQSVNWLNPRFYFHIDTMIGCRDASVTAWGQDKGIDPGEITFLYAKDRSGFNTGYSYDETGQVYESFFRGRKVFNFYNTDYEFSPFEHMVSYQVKRKHKEIDPFANETEQQMQDEATKANDVVANTLLNFKSKGLEKVSLADFKKEIAAGGLELKRARLIEHLQEIHNVTIYEKMGYPWLRLDDNIINLPSTESNVK